MAKKEITVAEREAELRGTIHAHKGHFTRKVNTIGKLLPPHLREDDIISKPVMDALDKELDKLTKHYDVLQDLYEALREVVVKEDELKTIDLRLTQVEDGYLQARMPILRAKDASARAAREAAMQPAAAPAAVPAAAAAAPAPRARIQESLRPDKLTLEFTPAEFRSWEAKFRAYYNTSEMDRLPNTSQQAYLFSCLGSALDAKLREIIDDNTTIFDRNGCMDIVRGEFQLKYPLFTRRLEFFRCKQAPGQPFSEFQSKLQACGLEADLQRMRVDEIYMFRYVTGITDDKLKEKMLQAHNPSLEDLKMIARTYEMAKTSMESMGKTDKLLPVEVNQASHDRGRSDRRGSAGPCFRCGLQGHVKAQCRKNPMDVFCKKCNRKGHVAEVCELVRSSTPGRTRSRSWSPSRSPGRSPERPQSRSPSRSPRRINTVDTFSVVNSVSQPTPRFLCVFETLNKSEHRRIRFAADAIPDTGATRTIMSEKVARVHGIPLKPSKERLRAANGTSMRVAGTVGLKVLYQGREAVVDIIVSSDLSADILMSWHDLIALGIIPKTFPAASRVEEARAVSAKAVSVPKVEEAACKELRDEMLAMFPDVFSDELNGQKLHGEEMHIHMDDSKQVTPKRVLTARQVPLHLREAADKLVESLVSDGILVPVEEPTDWISPGHFVPKPNGGVRLVTDYTQLNKVVKRPVHPFPCTREILQQLDSGSTVFAKMDAVHGYFQIPLDAESSMLTTFLIHSGRYRYKSAPMGLNASGDEWCRRSDVPFAGHPGTTKLVDDGLTQASSLEELRTRLIALFSDCREHNLTLSRKKFAIGSEVKFAGHVIGARGVSPDPEKVRAIKDFPSPKDLTALRSFLGMANQLGAFLPDLSQATEPLRPLMKKGVVFRWLEDHEKAFRVVKSLLTSDAVVKAFNPALKTELYTDASRLYGLGYMLLQREKDGSHRLIRCGSRSLQSAETRYSTIELECLAIVYAVSQCDYYLRGGDFHVVTDHRPLLGTFSKDLATVSNPRLLRYREKLQAYTFTISWTAGKVHHMADALSRAPVFAPSEEESELANEIVECFSCEDSTGMEGLVDSEYEEVVEAVRLGLRPKDMADSHPAKAYGSVWDSLSPVSDDKDSLLLLDGHRLVVPQKGRKDALKRLHAGHCGILKTMQLAKELYYWPGMNNSVKQMVEGCKACVEKLPSQVRQPVLDDIEEERGLLYPMKEVGVDLFTLGGVNYLVMVDRYSGFPFCKMLRSTSTSAVTAALMTWFTDWGFPQAIRSDGGPQFRSEFGAFCERFTIRHERSSPHHHESNGLAEAAVKNIKFLLAKCKSAKEDFPSALMEWRNTPRTNGVTPSVLFLGRRQKTNLLAHESVYRPVSDEKLQKMVSKKEDRAVGEEQEHDAHSRVLPGLKVGQGIVLQDAASKLWDRTGVVLRVLDKGRSYIVRMSDGKEYQRNRIFLRPDKTVSEEASSVNSASCNVKVPSIKNQLHSEQWAPLTPKTILRTSQSPRSKARPTKRVGFIFLKSTSPRSTSESPCSSSSGPSSSSCGSTFEPTSAPTGAGDEGTPSAVGAGVTTSSGGPARTESTGAGRAGPRTAGRRVGLGSIEPGCSWTPPSSRTSPGLSGFGDNEEANSDPEDPWTLVTGSRRSRRTTLPVR